MATLASRFRKLKMGIGGNREKVEFEHTFGTPVEEQQYITMPNPWQRRILSELDFALLLSAEQEHRFDSAIDEALDLLEGKMAVQGTLTNQDCTAAEEKLLPISGAAKAYELILAAHAHIDMNWMWGWQETVAAALATFRTMLDLMEEYPGFCFSQSQASVYKIVEDYDPAMMEEIKKRIQEGRWEVTASAWVETDKNMPSTESLLHHIKETRDYLEKHWGVDPASLEVDFSPDTFGHSANVPEIDRFGDVKYYYHCRGLDGNYALYRWQAPSGRELLAYREHYWYNSGITPQIGIGLIEVSRQSGGLKTGLIVYGVGDHGGGATRRDLERAIEMMEWPVFPRIQFGTVAQYFKKAEAVHDRLPLLRGELNYFAPGCYTTQSRLKLANRKNEKALAQADLFSSLAHANLKTPYLFDQFVHARQNILFTHFHDILTGSCVQESREYAMGLLSDSMAVSNTQQSNALRAFASRIDTSGIETDDDIRESQSEGAGAGYGLKAYSGVPNPERGAGKTRIFHVFNSQPFPRCEPVEITVWDWPGDLNLAEVFGAGGESVAFALLDQRKQNYWDHKYFRFLARTEVPAMGYTTLVLREKEVETYPHYMSESVRTSHPYQPITLENDRIKAVFDPHNGNMISLIDKSAGEELVKEGPGARLRFVHTECATSSAWEIGRYTSEEELTETTRICPFRNGALRQGFVAEKKIRNSTVKQTVYLDQGATAITFSLEIDWHENGNGDFIPVLVYAFPHAYETDRYRFDVPAGSQVRAPQYLDMPGLQYGAAINPDGRSVLLVSDSKYGYRCVDGQISLTLINTANNPDPYPERGIHHVTFAVAVAEDRPKLLEELASGINDPLHAVSANRHAGTLPLTGTLLSFRSETAVISGVTTANNGDLLVRCYETGGKETEVEIETRFPVQRAVKVDLMEHELEPAAVDGNRVTVSVKPYSLCSVRIG